MKRLLIGLLGIGGIAGRQRGSELRGLAAGWRVAWRLAWWMARPGRLRGAAVVVGPPAFYLPSALRVRASGAPPVVVAAPTPPVYTQSAQDWYYCQNPAGYYPSVPQCSTEWLQVAPQPQ